jgi:hypothetical protein
MIPVSLDVEMPHEDKESGITYFFKPMTDAAELAIKSVLRQINSNFQPFLSEAQKQVEAENPAIDKEAKPKAVRDRAIELSRKDAGTDAADKKELDALNYLIDSTLIRWTGEKALLFPADKRPSQCFTVTDRYKMLGVIMDLNTLGGAERKN